MVAYVMPAEGIDVAPPMSVAEAEQKRPRTFVEVARSREEPLTGFGTTLAEARTLVSYVALTGVAYPVASVLPELPEERVALLKKTLPTLPILPIDLFSRGTDMRWDRFKDTRRGRLHPQLPGDPGPEGERAIGDLRRRGPHQLAGRDDIEGALLRGQAGAPGRLPPLGRPRDFSVSRRGSP